ncbi:Hypothetical_protein [Hexamita inflata]|uniref:Hypothetical_protein n=1 Tax=Hexamita inflata TaxID=28002 RepID=A0AA86R1N1_9EUKA|nr:Hypothetical protein HINF_LOCUS51833 [Hexamita inflata]
MMMLLYLSLQKTSQLDRCISCIFKKQNNKNGLGIQISQLCKSKSSSTIEVMFQKETIVKSELKEKQDNITINIDQADNITVVVKHEEVKYIFYKRQVSTNIPRKKYVLTIIFVLTTVIIVSCFSIVLIVKKQKQKNQVVIITPKNSELIHTRILVQF